MRKKLAAVILSALVALASSSGISGGSAAPAQAVFRCLAVGIDRFVTQTDTYPCSANNARAAAALFRDFLPQGTEITEVTDGPGTAEELAYQIRNAFRNAAATDTSLLYISTHGVRWEEERGQISALILSDGAGEEAITAETLRVMLDPIPGEKVLILDACYSGAFAEAFRSDGYRVLTSSGAEEKSYFWIAEGESGRGYFTAALDSALRASDPDQIDPDGDGEVSLSEIAGRMREIYGASSICCCPEDSAESIFILPDMRNPGEKVLGIRFEPVGENDGQIVFSFRFRTEERTRLEYRLIPAGADGWDFEQAVRLPDRERTGRVRGLLAPGEKERTLRFSADIAGAYGCLLLQIISLRGQDAVPECTAEIRPAAAGGL